jgi:hypothetical protein
MTVKSLITLAPVLTRGQRQTLQDLHRTAVKGKKENITMLSKKCKQLFEY